MVANVLDSYFLKILSYYYYHYGKRGMSGSRGTSCYHGQQPAWTFIDNRTNDLWVRSGVLYHRVKSQNWTGPWGVKKFFDPVCKIGLTLHDILSTSKQFLCHFWGQNYALLSCSIFCHILPMQKKIKAQNYLKFKVLGKENTARWWRRSRLFEAPAEIETSFRFRFVRRFAFDRFSWDFCWVWLGKRDELKIIDITKSN